MHDSTSIPTFLRGLGFDPALDAPVPASPKRFPDGAQYRVEIPSVEGPACLAAVVEEGRRLGVTVHRASQGSGVFLHTDRELDEMAQIAASAPLEVSLFARPSAGWVISPTARAHGGFAASAFGLEGVAAQLEDCLRAAEHGFRSVLIGDVGVLDLFGRARAAGLLPADMQAKVSVMLPASNPASAALFERLGASTLNLPTDLSLAQIAAIRAVVAIPLDVYIESPDNLGGYLRYHELAELVRVASPIYLKFGLRNAPDVYPAGTHLEGTTVALTRERVRRARLGMELLERSGIELASSVPGAAGLAVPVTTA
ncbi:MAG: U32 family peptidase [Gaiellales bacterium]